MIWNKKKDGAENPGTETSAAQTAKAPVLFLQKNWKWLVPVVWRAPQCRVRRPGRSG